MDNKKYIKPEIQVVDFNETDVIATSWAPIVKTSAFSLDEFVDIIEEIITE